MGAIDSLAGSDITKWNEVMSVSFYKTIMKMALNRDVQDYHERLNNILRKKNEQ